MLFQISSNLFVGRKKYILIDLPSYKSNASKAGTFYLLHKNHKTINKDMLFNIDFCEIDRLSNQLLYLVPLISSDRNRVCQN